jgi:hypothetical protein
MTLMTALILQNDSDYSIDFAKKKDSDDSTDFA